MDDIGNLKVDVGVLKTKVDSITTLCTKMDNVIDKIVDQHDKHVNQIYTDMENRRLETAGDVKEIHDRIDTVLEKMQDTEHRIMSKMEEVVTKITNHQTEEKKQLDAILEWKWVITGGVLVLSWLLSHVKLDTIVKSFN